MPNKKSSRQARAMPKDPRFCAAPPEIQREINPKASPARIRAINEYGKIWNNGTQIRYYFFNRSSDGETALLRDGTSRFIPWRGSSNQKQMVRDGFQTWMDLGIGLNFVEVRDRSEAELRIGFMAGDGHWSYLGRDCLEFGSNQRTMNLDHDIRGPNGMDTVLHEIGHSIGLSHEHQNPNAGIKWDEPAVYHALAQSPNFWDEDTTYRNIIKKLPVHSVKGTEWDRNSIMHYPFEPGLILEPSHYRSEPLIPEPGLSPLDIAWVRKLYPRPEENAQLPKLKRYDSKVVSLDSGEQFDAIYVPDGTDVHSISTFGKTDLVLTVFEDTEDGPRFLMGDDDGGQEQNASLELKLMKGKTYIIRTRLYFNDADGEFCLLVH